METRVESSFIKLRNTNKLCAKTDFFGVYVSFCLLLFFLTKEKFVDLIKIQQITLFTELKLQLTETIYFQEHYLYVHLSIKPCYIFMETYRKLF